MLKDILGFLVFVIIFFFMGMLIEYAKTNSKSLRELSNNLKRDLVDIIKGFFEKPKIRHIFEEGFANELRNVIKPFLACGMDIDIGNFYNPIPCIIIEFVPAKPMVEEEMDIVCQRVRSKFKRYITARNIQMKYFTSYTQGPDTAQIYIYYAEFDTDLSPLRNRYQEIVREKKGADLGLLRDDDLDKELKEIKDDNPTRI